MSKKVKTWEYEDDNFVLFWGGVLSNWHLSKFSIGGVEYNSVEQFMMQQKAREFSDLNVERMIMNSRNPKEQKQFGRIVANFDAQHWMDVCLERVLPGVLAKFEQNEELKLLLLSTGKKVLAEASPYDKIWGIGLQYDDPRALNEDTWQGTNYLGELLMIVRSSLAITKEHIE